MGQTVAIDRQEFSFDELMTDDAFEEPLATNEIRSIFSFVEWNNRGFEQGRKETGEKSFLSERPRV